MRSELSMLSLHKLEVFCAVVDEGGVSRAAEKIGIAQPVVSAHLAALAQKLRVVLTVRSSRGLKLTEEGRAVYRSARQIFVQIQELERELSELREGSSGAVTIGASLTYGSYVLPPLVAEFHRENPSCCISVRIADPADLIEMVRAGECDFAVSILDEPLSEPALSSKILSHETLILVGSPQAAALAEPLDAAALAGLTYVTAERGSTRRQLEDALLLGLGLRHRRISLEFGHAEAMKQAVLANAGFAFLFYASVRNELSNGSLKHIKTADLDVPIHLIWKKGKRSSALTLKLIDQLSAMQPPPDR